MRIASKINAALFGVFAAGTLATFGVLNTVILPKFEDIEQTAAQTNHKRIVEAFDAFTQKVETATHDYAIWDETYKFIQDEADTEFVASNLEPEFKAVENLGINVLLFLKDDGTVRWGAAYDLETKEALPGVIGEIATLALKGKAESKRGLIETSKGIFLIAKSPILKSDGSGPAFGKVVSAKFLDLEAVKTLTEVNFKLLPIAEQPAATKDIVMKVGKDQIVTTSLITDIFDQPLVALEVNSPRDVSTAGMVAIRSAALMMLLAGFVSLGVLWTFLRLTVVDRIDSLSRHFTVAGSSGRIKSAELGESSDEIGDLARSFNGMASQVNHLRDALADSAYMDGLSEWAAGTLHNVRNGLVPVANTTWKIEKLFDSALFRNIQIASAQHADPATDPERRKSLNAFLVAAASSVTDIAKQTKEMTATITGASKNVLEMVTEFERYTQRKSTAVEPVDLLPLLKSVTADAANTLGRDIEFVLPARSVEVDGNRVVLRQVFSNIVVNAVEAIAAMEANSPGRRGRIEIQIDARTRSSDAIRIAVIDNGEGVSADKLQSIFHRGVSTRQSRAGGLGLHWCANAIKLLGGTIHAESEGPGRGTTMVIQLHHPKVQQEAA